MAERDMTTVTPPAPTPPLHQQWPVWKTRPPDADVGDAQLYSHPIYQGQATTAPTAQPNCDSGHFSGSQDSTRVPTTGPASSTTLATPSSSRGLIETDELGSRSINQWTGLLPAVYRDESARTNRNAKISQDLEFFSHGNDPTSHPSFSHQPYAYSKPAQAAHGQVSRVAWDASSRGRSHLSTYASQATAESLISQGTKRSKSQSPPLLLPDVQETSSGKHPKSTKRVRVGLDSHQPAHTPPLSYQPSSEQQHQLQAEQFDGICELCVFYLHSPDSHSHKKWNACKRTKGETSHLVTHYVDKHLLIRIPELLLTKCASDENHDGAKSRCTNCPGINITMAQNDPALEDPQHAGPALCLKCWDRFPSKKAFWLHLKEGCIKAKLTMAQKSRRIYETFCSTFQPPALSPDNHNARPAGALARQRRRPSIQPQQQEGRERAGPRAAELMPLRPKPQQSVLPAPVAPHYSSRPSWQSFEGTASTSMSHGIPSENANISSRNSSQVHHPWSSENNEPGPQQPDTNPTHFQSSNQPANIRPIPVDPEFTFFFEGSISDEVMWPSQNLYLPEQTSLDSALSQPQPPQDGTQEPPATQETPSAFIYLNSHEPNPEDGALQNDQGLAWFGEVEAYLQRADGDERRPSYFDEAVGDYFGNYEDRFSADDWPFGT